MTPDTMMSAEFTGVPNSSLLVRSERLGGGALSRALQAGTTPPDWTIARPQNAEAWRKRVTDVRSASAGHDWLTPLAPALAATGQAAARLARAVAHGVVVTTGQQPGLFGGPLYTWTKAMSALTLADALEEATGVPVAPVFWAATDDADWWEASATHVVGLKGLETLELGGPPSENIAMAEVALGNISHLHARLRAAAGSVAHAEVLELLEAAYVPHATIGAAYVQLLRGILEPMGISVLDAAHPATRMASDPMLRRALAAAAALDDGMRERTAEIRAHGFEPQVLDVEGLSLVFRTTRTERGNIRERVPIALASRTARESEPGTLGANVLLRPVIERSLMPTVAYLAGPGEFAYFAQVAPVSHILGTAAPMAVPRWSGVIIEPHVARLLERLGVDERSLEDPHEVESRLARESLKEQVADALERVRLATETQMRALKSAVTDADGLVADTVIDGSTRAIAQRLNRLERRLIAAVKRREQSLMRDIAVARASLKPMGKSPERVLNVIPALSRYGPQVFDAMRTGARAHAMMLVHGTTPALP